MYEHYYYYDKFITTGDIAKPIYEPIMSTYVDIFVQFNYTDLSNLVN